MLLKNTGKKLVAFALLFCLLLGVCDFAPVLSSFAATGGSKIQSATAGGLFSAVQLQYFDSTSNSFKDVPTDAASGSISADSKTTLQMLYTFDSAVLQSIATTMAADHSYNADNYTYTFSVPDQLLMGSNGTENFYLNPEGKSTKQEANDSIAYIQPDGSKKSVSVTFLSRLADHSSETFGSFGMALLSGFASDADTNSGTISITFSDAVTSPTTINVSTTVTKTKANATVTKVCDDSSSVSNQTWLATIVPNTPSGYKDADITGFNFSDSLSNGIDFDSSSFDVYYAPANTALSALTAAEKIDSSKITTSFTPAANATTPASMNGSISGTFSSGAGKNIYLVYKTKQNSYATPSSYTDNNSAGGLKASYNNTFTIDDLLYTAKDGTKDASGTPVTTNVDENYSGSTKPSATATYSKNSEYVNKDGSVTGDQISWNVSVNSSKSALSKMDFTDTIPTAQVSLPTSISISKNNGTAATGTVAAIGSSVTIGDYTVTTTDANTLTFTHSTISSTSTDSYKITYDTALNDTVRESEKTTNVNNAVSFNYGGTNPIGISKSVNVSPVLSKSVSENTTKDQLDYTITVNKDWATLSDPIVYDYLSDDLQLFSSFDKSSMVSTTYDTSSSSKIYSAISGKIGSGYTIYRLNKDAVSDTLSLAQTSVSSAYQSSESASDFYLYYCVNDSAAAGQKAAVVAMYKDAETGTGSVSIHGCYTILLHPTVINDTLWKANQQSSGVNYTIANTAYLKSIHTDFSKTATADHKVSHTVISKNETAYDANNHTYQWTAAVDESAVKLKNVKLTDTLDDNQVFFIDSTHPVKIGSTTISAGTGTASEKASGYYVVSSDQKTMTVYFPEGTISAETDVTYFSQIIDSAIAVVPKD